MTRYVRDPAQHVFVGGDLDDVPVIAELVASLPPTAYGQVVVAFDGPVADLALPVPSRVQVHRLAGRRTAEARGDAVAAAARAWVGEWMLEDPARVDRTFVVWLGCPGSAAVTDVERTISDSLESAGNAGL